MSNAIKVVVNYPEQPRTPFSELRSGEGFIDTSSTDKDVCVKILPDPGCATFAHNAFVLAEQRAFGYVWVNPRAVTVHPLASVKRVELEMRVKILD